MLILIYPVYIINLFSLLVVLSLSIYPVYIISIAYLLVLLYSKEYFNLSFPCLYDP